MNFDLTVKQSALTKSPAIPAVSKTLLPGNQFQIITAVFVYILLPAQKYIYQTAIQEGCYWIFSGKIFSV